jgi:uncharacterized protein
MIPMPHATSAAACARACSRGAATNLGYARRAVALLKRHVDFPVAAIFGVVGVLAVAGPAQVWPTLRFSAGAVVVILPWLAISVTCAAYARASGLDRLVARAFTGRPARMIVLAALAGALSPFCSCGVIPVIAGLLAAGVPLAPVMAFWLSSPLMDPNMFALTAATMGLEFALAKLLAAIGVGLMSGLVTRLLAGRLGVGDGLRVARSGRAPSAAGPVRWNVFATPGTRQAFASSAGGTGWFLLRWMTFAFVLESLMVAWLPAERVIALLGEESMAIPIAVLVGVPAYINGFAALPLVSGLVGLGMSPAAALAFLVSGGIASVPAAAAVWALARPRVFMLYLGLGVVGSLLAAWTYAVALASGVLG